MPKFHRASRDARYLSPIRLAAPKNNLLPVHSMSYLSGELARMAKIAGTEDKSTVGLRYLIEIFMESREDQTGSPSSRSYYHCHWFSLYVLGQIVSKI